MHFRLFYTVSGRQQCNTGWKSGRGAADRSIAATCRCCYVRGIGWWKFQEADLQVYTIYIFVVWFSVLWIYYVVQTTVAGNRKPPMETFAKAQKFATITYVVGVLFLFILCRLCELFARHTAHHMCGEVIRAYCVHIHLCLQPICLHLGAIANSITARRPAFPQGKHKSYTQKVRNV